MSRPSSAERVQPTRVGAAPLAAAAVFTVLALAGGVVVAVGQVEPPATGVEPPPLVPPGPQEAAGRVDTVGDGDPRHSAAAGPEGGNDTAGSDGSRGADSADPSADERHTPADSTARPSPEWLDEVSQAAGIPRRALEGYASAQLRLMESDPACQVSWPTLAGIGYVESRHGTYAGGEIGPDGTTTVDVIGIPLNGDNGTMAIPDTDAGALDGDTEWDRAVGPMQFIPSTWELWGASAGGGDPDPHNIDDAALSAARYLCTDGRDLTAQDDWREAVLSYNRSGAYVRDVLAAANRYAAAAR